jgi:hypothetical protein
MYNVIIYAHISHILYNLSCLFRIIYLILIDCDYILLLISYWCVILICMGECLLYSLQLQLVCLLNAHCLFILSTLAFITYGWIVIILTIYITCMLSCICIWDGDILFVACVSQLCLAASWIYSITKYQ